MNIHAGAGRALLGGKLYYFVGPVTAYGKWTTAIYEAVKEKTAGMEHGTPTLLSAL